MPFGLRNSSQTFQRYMDLILQPCREYAAAYIDDIVIYSDSEEQHKIHVDQIIHEIKQAGLKINDKKCLFNRTSIDFLGFQISSHAISPVPTNVEVIQNMRKPANGKELRRFIGTMAFYQWMLPHLPETMAYLHKLTAAAARDKKKLVWTDVQASRPAAPPA